MVETAKYIRIFNLHPDDDYASKRTAAIKLISQGYSKKKLIGNIISLGNDIVPSIVNPKNIGSDTLQIVEKALKAKSSSFISEGEELQISICALIAALELIDNLSPSSILTTGDVLAISLWSGLSFVEVAKSKPIVEELKQEIVSKAQEIIFSSALTSRERTPVPNISKQITASAETTVPQLAEKIDKTLNSFTSPMRRNAVLDREEIDVLWWLLHGWSQIAKVQLINLDETQRAILAGFEITTFLRRLPSHLHKKLALKDANGNLKLNSSELIEKLKPISSELKESFLNSELAVNNPHIFPLTTLILNGVSEDTPAHKTKRTLEEWSARAVIEGSMLHISNFMNQDI